MYKLDEISQYMQACPEERDKSLSDMKDMNIICSTEIYDAESWRKTSIFGHSFILPHFFVQDTL